MTTDLPLDSTIARSVDPSASAPGAPEVRTDVAVGRGAIGRFAILARLGEGGMGVVYSAYDESLDRRVAIKVLKDGHAVGGGETDLRMRREAQALARLSHPNVVQVYEVGVVDGQIFVAMEYIAGRTLRGWRAEAERPWQDIVAMYLQAGRGLAAAHAAGLVHRDFKPDNVLVGADGRARVLDFGLARSVESPPDRPAGVIDHAPRPSGPDPAAALAHHGLEPLTRADAIVGTLRYMAPEQYLRAPVTRLADQYSFCVALFEALYGVPPHAGETLYEFVQHRLDGEIVAAPRDTAVPDSVHRILLRGLATQPADRWTSLDDLLEALSGDPKVAADPQNDLGVGRRHRVYICVAFVVGSGLYMVGVIVQEATRTTPGTTRETLDLATVSVLISWVMFPLIWRRVSRNTINRRLIGFALLLTAAAWFNHLIGHVLAVPLAAVVVGDMLIIAGMSAVAAISLVRWLGWAAALFAAGTLAGVLLPHVASIVVAICQFGVSLLVLRMQLVSSVVPVASTVAPRGASRSAAAWSR